MSVTFAPAANTVITYVYYEDDGMSSYCNNEVQNGIMRIPHEEPSLNYSNARAGKLMQILRFGSRIIHEDGAEETVLYGRIPEHRCKDLLKTVEKLSQDQPNLADCYNLFDFKMLLRHCIYHNCDLIYG